MNFHIGCPYGELCFSLVNAAIRPLTRFLPGPLPKNSPHPLSAATLSTARASCLLALLIGNPLALGQTLTNGLDHAGALALRTTNSYTFYATNGDSLLLRIGAPTFRPLLTLHAPNGTSLDAASGSGSSSLDASLSLTAATNGVFTVRASSYYGTGSGAYSLSFGRIPAAFETAPEDEGGSITNGAARIGNLALGDLDLWNFSASKGDNLLLRIGAAGLRPMMNLYAPNGALIASQDGATSSDTDALITAQATNTGIFTIAVQSYYPNGAGSYRINYAKSPGAFVVPQDDQGGPLANGAAETGEISKGDLDLWTFDATSGDNVLIRIGSPAFRPWLRLYAPSGILIREGAGAGSGDKDAIITLQVTNTGTFTLIAQSYYYSLSSDYSLSLAKLPGPFTTSSADEGGLLTNGIGADATNTLGDIDMWKFAACKDYPLTLDCQKLSGTLTPRLRLYGRNGILLKSVQNATRPILDYTPTNSGLFTLLIDGAALNDSGKYHITAYGVLDDALQVCPPQIKQNTVELTGLGGTPDRTFLVLVSTNAAAPHSQWTPTQTNTFDSFGAFGLTTPFHPLDPARFYRLVTDF